MDGWMDGWIKVDFLFFLDCEWEIDNNVQFELYNCV